MTTDLHINLQKYADVILKIGLGFQPGQRLLVGSPVRPAPFEAAPLLQIVAEKAYQCGARLIDVVWGDDQLRLARLRFAAEDTLDEFSDWGLTGYVERVRQGDALLNIHAITPDLYAGIDPERVGRMAHAAARLYRPIGDLVSANATNWLVIAVATPGWAVKVFPDLPVEDAVERLWAAIFAACRIDREDPLAEWESHLEKLAQRSRLLTARQYTALHYRGPGTDLTVGLPENHIWIGGREHSQTGIDFAANLPTEEVYTLPHREQAEGTVAFTRPFFFAGGAIEGACLSFRSGHVDGLSARVGERLLSKVIETDDGAGRLGEAALVPNSSPISQTGLIFHNILFDENAACHFALGDAYRSCLDEGVGMNEDDFQAAGGNSSGVHLDFMIGSGELDVDGVRANGDVEAVMRQGEWIEEV